MPRLFEPEGDDSVIYDEEQEVAEMYFILEGVVGIGFSLIRGITQKQHYIVK